MSVQLACESTWFSLSSWEKRPAPGAVTVGGVSTPEPPSGEAWDAELPEALWVVLCGVMRAPAGCASWQSCGVLACDGGAPARASEPVEVGGIAEPAS